MNADPEPNTVQGRFIDHMQLAARWLAFNDRPYSQEGVLRVMSRYEPEELRRALGSLDRRSAS